MVRLSDIIRKLTDIQLGTLRDPTHILVSEAMAADLLDQYNELVNSDASTVYELGERSHTLEDVGDFLGVRIVYSKFKIHDFKVLEEITPDS